MQEYDRLKQLLRDIYFNAIHCFLVLSFYVHCFYHVLYVYWLLRRSLINK